MAFLISNHEYAIVAAVRGMGPCGPDIMYVMASMVREDVEPCPVLEGFDGCRI
jgi:hypothetical protein